MPDRGIFITFEGSEGVGKSTQARLAAEKLRAQGHRVVVTREPGGTPIGELIRHTLQNAKESVAMSPEAELLLFAASRAQLVRELIAPSLAKGIDVVSDRYLDSTTVYQGVARRLQIEDVERINRFAAGGCIPDITFVLDLPAAEARLRLARRASPGDPFDRIEEEAPEFFERVREGYLRLAESEPARIRVVDGSLDRDHLACVIAAHIRETLHGISTA